MFKSFLHYPRIEPTHARVGFYFVPLMAWILLPVFYIPNTIQGFVLTVLATLIATVFIPAIIFRHTPGYLTITPLSNGEGPPCDIAVNESVLMCGKLNSVGTRLYLLSFLITIFIVFLVFLYDSPDVLMSSLVSISMSILVALALDLLLSLVLFSTDFVDSLCSAQARPDGILISNHLKKWQDVEIAYSAAGFGLVKVAISGDGHFRCYLLNSDSVRFIEYHSKKSTCLTPSPLVS